MDNLFLVPLQSPAFWLLTTPIHSLKQPPYMIGVIPNAKVLVNGFGNPLQGPKVCPVSCSQWT
jgi:hypothetical protein